jgi:hypothetical protein
MPGSGWCAGVEEPASLLIEHSDRIVSMAKMYLTSYERVTEYMELPQEPPRTSEDDPGKGWPSTGAIEFDNVSMR